MKNIKSLICLSSALVLSTPAMAAWEGSWLLGLSAGYGARSGDATASIAYPAPSTVLTDIVHDNKDSGFLWGALAGYQARCNGWLFGAELNVDWHDYDDAESFAYTNGLLQPTSGSFAFDRGTVLGLSFRAGYELNPYIMPYIRLGAETSDDDLTFSTTTNTATGVNAVITGSERTVRFLGGLGVEMPIPAVSGLTTRWEYNYHSQGKVVDARGYSSDLATFLTAGSKPDTHSGKFSLVYNFM
jgi:opacity protein-like surface antigen